MQQLSYLSGISEKPLLGITIGDMFDHTVQQYPQNEALIVPHQDIIWTYQTLKEKVDACARAFMAIGLEKGERIGIWAPNRFEWLLTQLATAKIGAILVNINPSYQAEELKYALNQSGCKMLVMAHQFKSSNFTHIIQSLAPELAKSQAGQLASSSLPHLKTIIRLLDEPQAGMFTWKDFMTQAAQVSSETLANQQAALTFDEPINIQYTSGTTGYPKGATLSHHNILNNGYFVVESMQFTNRDRLIIPVPLYHCFGMVMGNLGCISHGATMIYPSEAFEPEMVLKAAQEYKATAIYGVPTMFIAELEHPHFGQYDLSSLRTGIMAGSPCPIEVMKQVQSLMNMKDVQIAYGMTETSPVSTQTRLATPLEKQVSTVGQIHPHLEVKIVDPETKQTLPINTAGELCTRGYSVMLGYWNDAERTSQVIDSARWMHTGDMAVIDEDGYVNIVGRIKDMIIRGGENLYPREIEEFLYTHPAISDVQVIGVPSSKYGEEVMAWVKLREGQNLSEAAIKEYCLGKISKLKIPKYIKFTDSFPMTVTGKIRKVEMRKISIQELGLDQEAKIQTA